MKLAPGTIIDQRFRIVSELGAGGMATVYRADQSGVDRVVALKVMSAATAVNESKRFLREARLLSRLSHPAICQFYHCGLISQEHPYIVMELCSGCTLRSIIAGGPLDFRRTIGIMSQVAEALSFAHANSVLHRDLSPQNILVAEDGSVKIIDFGLAKALYSGETTITATGAIVGTVHYISPEQAIGANTQPQSDVYAFGCILFEMLSGKPPYEADTALGIIYKHGNESFPQLKAFAAGVSGDVKFANDLIGWCTAKNWQDRPSSAQLAAIMRDVEKGGTAESVLPSRGMGRPRVNPRLLIFPVMPIVLSLAIGLWILKSFGGGFAAAQKVEQLSLSGVIGYAERSRPALSDAQSEELVAGWVMRHRGAATARECLRLAQVSSVRRPATALRLCSLGLSSCELHRTDPEIVCGLGALKFRLLNATVGNAAAQKFAVESSPRKFLLTESDGVTGWNAMLLAQRIAQAYTDTDLMARLVLEYCNRYKLIGAILRDSHRSVFCSLGVLVSSGCRDKQLLSSARHWVAVVSQDSFLVESMSADEIRSWLSALISMQLLTEAEQFWNRVSPTTQSRVEKSFASGENLDELFGALKQWDRAIAFCIGAGQYEEAKHPYTALELYRKAVHWQARTPVPSIPKSVYARMEELFIQESDKYSDEMWAECLVSTVCEARPTAGEQADKLLRTALSSSRYKNLKPANRAEVDSFAKTGRVSDRIGHRR